MEGFLRTEPELDVARYRQALGSFLTGVTVVTTVDREGRDRGLTANSFTSVSLNPPLVLFCVDKRAGSFECFASGVGYVVHILGSEQQELAKTFASKSPTKFEGIDLGRSTTGAAIIVGVHATLDCSVETVVEAGDHAVVIGRVNAFSVEEKRPLGFYQGKMQSFHAEEELAALARTSGSALNVLWLIETGAGAVILAEDSGRLRLPESSVPTGDLHSAALSEVASKTLGCRVGIDFLYSVYGAAGDSLTLVYRGRAEPSDDTVILLPEGFVQEDADSAATLLNDATQSAVLERYVNERGDTNFGIYAGSADLGEVAMINAVSTT